MSTAISAKLLHKLVRAMTDAIEACNR